MAEGKKSFIAYSNWKDIFDVLPNEDAGKLIKHIFAYVNDENPVTDSILINAVFANIKATLKRDLSKWESELKQRSEAGKRSAEQRARIKSNETPTTVESRQRNPTDNVNVSVNDSVNVNVNEIHNTDGWGENLKYFETRWKELKPTHSLWTWATVPVKDSFKSLHSLSTKEFIDEVIGKSMLSEFTNSWSAIQVVTHADEIINNKYIKEGDIF